MPGRAPDTIPAFDLPADLDCRVVVPETPRNPYGIRICEVSSPRAGRHPGSEREVLYAMFALEVTTAGTKVVACDRGARKLAPGRAALVSPGVYRVRESDGYASIVVFFNGRFPCDFLQQNFGTVPAPDGNTAHAGRIGVSGLQWFVASIQAIFQEKKYFPCMCRVMLQNTMLRLLTADPVAVRGLLATAALRNPGGLPELMARHTTESIPNERLARLCGKSLSAFHRHFAEVFGTTPQRWLRERRLERARTLLSATAMTVTEICYETGFKDTAHFSRVFRQRYGMSPRQTRVACPEARASAGTSAAGVKCLAVSDKRPRRRAGTL